MSSPLTPRPMSSHDVIGDFSEPNDFDIVDQSGNGPGNLADELAGAFDEDEEDEGVGSDVPGAQFDEPDAVWNCNLPRRSMYANLPLERDISFQSPQKHAPTKHCEQNSQYDDSDNWDDNNLEGVIGISQSLEASLAAIESLVRRGAEENGSSADDLVERVADSLKNLGSQAGVEDGAARLMTAHRALTSHLTRQTRALRSLSHPYLSPFSSPPDTESIDELLPLFASLFLAIPSPQAHPLASLHGLQSSTADLVSTLTYLSDALYMTRQTTTLASRRLRAARGMVVEMRKEAEAGEEGARWVEQGNWGNRLASREFASICGDVMGGFEETCADWRKRLEGGMGVEVGAA